MDKDQNQLKKIWHSAEHVLNKAMLKLYPGLKMAMGPATDEGFYFDFDYEGKITEDDFPKIEKEMQNIIKDDQPFVEKEVSPQEARKLFTGNEYKLEWVDEIEERKEKVTLYTTGEDFVDLCSGPHVESTKEIGAFKLLSVAGAYWRGSEKNKMLTRIYGTAFPTQKELDEYLNQIEEAKKRDHRKLGRELDLFCFSDLVGPGLPLFTPKGVIIIDELKKHIEQVCRNHGFQKVMAPSLAKIELFETSGHAQKFGEELFHVTSERKHDFVLKPVQCPHHTQIYASRIRSYRDLPIRYMESDKMYRAEKAGEVGGLSRVYAITVEDGHSFCRVDQVKEEVKIMVKIIKEFYTALGMWENHWVSLSVRDYSHPERYIGDKKDWDLCEKMLEEISDEMGLHAKRCEGEAALYGPKLDFMFKDSLGKEVQIPTVQLDFATPKRFNLVYIGEDGKEQSPVMVHRAVLGSYERFLLLLIENFAGAFPTWLSPVQVQIVPITDRNLKYGQNVLEQLLDSNIRAEIDSRAETMQSKIRDAQMQRIPYMLIIGDREENEGKVAVRTRDGKDLGAIEISKFLENIKIEIEGRQ